MFIYLYIEHHNSRGEKYTLVCTQTGLIKRGRKNLVEVFVCVSLRMYDALPRGFGEIK